MAAPIDLLDVNVLIALLDPEHVHHEPADGGGGFGSELWNSEYGLQRIS